MKAFSLMLMIPLFAALPGCSDISSSGAPVSSARRAPVALPPVSGTQPAPDAANKTEVWFGKARIALGMTRQQVLEAIRLSRTQYEPLEDARSPEIYVRQPSEAVIRSDTWALTCPARNSRMLGGGSGIMLEVQFREGKVIRLTQGGWVAG